ncbi:MAG: mechanosensitive ion channel family protein [Ahrensia sp.]|nr:mechanosensitive ion channel family protein [Ahrensia sp.]
MKDTRYWITILISLVALAVAEVYFGDIIIDSQTQSISSLTKVLVVLIGGGILTLLCSEALRRYLISQRPVNTGRPSAQNNSPRALSVIPLIRAILFTIIVVLALLIALAEFGVDIGPMLAGAGVVGLVVGLGAQSLLIDILAGIFYVIDDAFRIGEYVEIGTQRGTVEQISLRSMKVRHHHGALQTIPYGTILSISNHSRDWVIVKLTFQLPLDTEVMRVKKIVKAVSATFLEEAEFAPYIIEPLKFQGIDNVDLYGLNVRLKFMAVPGEQFTMRREMLRRLQQAFAENGIEFAKRSVTVSTDAPAVAAADDEDELITPSSSTR